MITVHLNRSNGAPPLYLQLYHAIRDLIIRGSLSEGELLPSKRALATHLNVSLKTVETAYQQLAVEGYIHARQRVGYFVSPLGGYREKRKRPLPYVSRYRETKYLLDVKANKNPADVFPKSVWLKLGRETMAEHLDDLLETVPFNGILELRVAIAHYLSTYRNMQVSPEQIIIGSGTEYLYLRLLQLLSHERSSYIVGLDDPGYGHIATILENMGIEHRAIPTDDMGMIPAELETSGCNAINISPAHSFPLGSIMPVQRRVELLTWANEASNRFIIEDDYNSEYLYRSNPITPMFEIDMSQKVIYMNTFSKSIAPSLRLAYMVLPERLMDAYLASMSFYSSTVSSQLQSQVAKFISKGHFERLIRRTSQHNIDTQKKILDALDDPRLSQHITAKPSSAGTHLLLFLHTEMPDEEVLQGLRQRGILASFVSQCCRSPRPDLDHQLIVNYSRLDDEKTRLLLGAVAEVLETGDRAKGFSA